MSRLRGPTVARLLRSLGIDPVRYWLLVDLFGELADRREVMTQLGRNGGALKIGACLYFAMSCLGTLLVLMARPALSGWFAGSLFMTAFLLLTVLLPETNNSLVNPVESLVLAHQPINGATYTAAKLSHLFAIVAYLVAALNVAPAFGGLALRDSPWFYPAVHLGVALALGLLVALLCCSAFGLLLRFMPPARVKAAGQVIEVLPFSAFLLFGHFREARAQLAAWTPALPVSREVLLGGLAVSAPVIVLLGLRSLSADYLVRVSAIVQGGSAAPGRNRRSWVSGVVARWFGGPPARAGLEYVARMSRRDWGFRRHLVPLLPLVAGPVVGIARGWAGSPFGSDFSTVHVIPHLFGVALFWICTLLPYGDGYKGAWIFLLAPAGAFGHFARGVYAHLWVYGIVLPHLLLLPVFTWCWGFGPAALFVAFSFSVASCYLAMVLRHIDAVPFTRQPEATRSPEFVGVTIAGGVAIMIAVALQHFLLFRSPVSVAAATAVTGAVALVLTRRSLAALELAMRFHLGLQAQEAGSLYVEV